MRWQRCRTPAPGRLDKPAAPPPIRAGIRPGRALSSFLLLVWLCTPHVAASGAAAVRQAGPGVDDASALILGRVIDGITGRPVAGALVRMGAAAPAVPGEPRGGLTNGAGQFLFRGLTAGRYTLAITSPGYLDGAYGQTRPGDVSHAIDLEPKQKLGDITIRIWKGASIAGRVVDEAHAPFIDVAVSLLRAEPRAGRRTYALAGTARTDDRGMFQFPLLPPGDYYVGVTSREVSTSSSSRKAAARRVYPTTFHPRAPSPDSGAVIALDTGAARSGIDLELEPIASITLEGTISAPSGGAAGVNVLLVPAYAAYTSLERVQAAGTATTDARGTFQFPDVSPGDYVLRAWRRPDTSTLGETPLSSDPGLWADARVSVGLTAPEPVALVLRPGARVNGRVVFAGTSAVGRPSMLQPMLGQIFEPAMPQAIGRAVARMAADYTFVTEGLPPGRYFLRVPSPLTPRGWHFESAVSDEGDLTIHPLDLQSAHAGEVVITFSDQPTGLRGLVVDPAGAPATDAAVLVFPLESDEWIRDGMNPAAVHHSAVSQAGMYTADVPPGDYLVTAVRPADAARWFDPGVLRRLLSNAARVTLTRGVVLQHNFRRP